MTNNVKLSRPSRAGNKAGSPAFACLYDLLVHYGRLAPDQKAILIQGQAPVTYGSLLTQAHYTVRKLRSFGICRTDRVAVVLPNGPETAIAVIGVAAGAVCVPLNPGFTADEWQRYFADLGVSALLTRADLDSASRGVAHTLGIPIIDLAREGSGAFSFVCSTTRRPAGGEFTRSTDDAIILLTSGTTSRPKMIPLTHENICRSAYNAAAALALGRRDRLLNMLPLFHAHGLISGLLAALAAGSSLVCTRGFDATAFFGWLREFRPTWYTAVPAIHRAILSAASRHSYSAQRCSLRLIRSASSSLPLDVLGGLEALFGVPVIETYGMTEAASQIAANPLGRRKPGSVGQATGVEIAIVNGEGRQLSAGERGEILLRGPTITRGYDNDRAATDAAFRDGWFRTGDIGYLDLDGYLFVVGRIKDIINRGGQKIAPAEVEEVLLNCPDVVEAVAFSIPHRRLGEDVAAAVVLRQGANVSVQRLRDFTREHLAKFKVPGLLKIVPEIPKGPGGKIKRDGLVAALSLNVPERGVKSGGKLAAPCSQSEWLAKTWAELLEVDEVGLDQDVFALGADSLTATQMLSRLRARFGAPLSFDDIFDAPTVAALAARLKFSETDPAAVCTTRNSPMDDADVYLSFQQQRFYVLSRLDATGYGNQVVEVARLSGSLDIGALEASITTICERHEVLRSRFHERRGVPVQIVNIDGPRLERLDLGFHPMSRRAAAIQSQARASLYQSFNIQTEPSLRVRLLRLDENDHALVITLHHLITDAWSQRLFWEELELLYAARVNGNPVALPKLPIQYRHFVESQRAWLQTRVAENQRSYWRSQLDGLIDLPLRTDRPRPKMPTGRGARYPLKFSKTLSREIKSLSRAHRVTVFMTLLAAFQYLLYRYTKHDNIAVGSMIANRTQIQIERLMGVFANTIVLRTDLSGDPKFCELLQRIRKVTIEAYRNQELPIEEILRVLKVSRNMDRNTLFQVMFILQNASPRAPTLPGLSVRFEDVDPGVARCDLILELIDADGGLRGWLEYSTDLFEGATIARMGAHLRTLLEAIVANPEERISRLPLLQDKERRRILIDWNDTQTRFGGLGNFWERFARRVERVPNATAVSDGRVRMSYRELAHRSSGMANRLSLEGVKRDAVVVLLASRSANLLAAMIAVQRAGGAFLPLDPALPAARLAQIVQHSRTPLVLAEEECAPTLEEALSGMPTRERPQILSLEDLAQEEPRHAPRPVRPGPTDLAYVIYTSGSTGVPKGAMVEQRGLLNHLCSQISYLKLSASDVIAHTAPQSYVISVWQFLTALMIGARVHICADEAVRDPMLLVQEVNREGVTVLQIVPAMLRAILERMPKEPSFRVLSQLRWLISTGEALAPDLCRDWFRHFPDVPMINAYGASECSDDVAMHRIVLPPASIGTLPIGRAIANTRLYVLDAHLQPEPVGVVGELFIGGICVGRGYLNDPEQTRRSFIRDPFSNGRASRLYKTGDLARRRVDGTLEVLGRVDYQVKIRGYRIELEEIEHALLEHADVRAAIVLARVELGGETRLIAHVVAAANRQPEVNDLRDFLKTKLPNFMIPAGFVFLECMPVTMHGKVDRGALLAISKGPYVAGFKFVAPRNSTEKILVQIWADLLGIDQIGIFDDFFDLGGHSLLAGQVQARIANTLGMSLPIRVLFEAPTVEALAQRIEFAREAQLSELEAAPEFAFGKRDGSPVISIVQEHMLRIERELPGLPQFNLASAYHLEGPLNVRAFEQSIAEVMRRHDSLRTKFAWVDERPVALVAPVADIDPPLVFENLASRTSTKSGRGKALVLKKAALQAEQEAWTSFDMSRAPLFRVRLLQLDHDNYVLILILHHIIIDGWSIGVFIDEISHFYAAFTTGRKVKLSQPALQFSDFARWQRLWCTTGVAARQLAFWKERLREASPIFLRNGDRRRGLLSSRIAYEPVRLPSDLVARLSELSRHRGGTLFITLLTGFKALLLKRNGRNDICVATSMANRSQMRTERLIGPLQNTALIRTRIDADMSFQEALHRVRESVLEALARQELPFETVATRLAEEDGMDPATFIQVFFVLQNFRRWLKLPQVAITPFGNIYQEGQPVLPIDRTWLTVSLEATSSGITGSFGYKSGLFELDIIRYWIADYRTILANAVAKPETLVGRLADR